MTACSAVRLLTRPTQRRRPRPCPDSAVARHCGQPIFVTNGIESAFKQAKQASGDPDMLLKQKKELGRQVEGRGPSWSWAVRRVRIRGMPTMPPSLSASGGTASW
jgi:hypothetical protein